MTHIATNIKAPLRSMTRRDSFKTLATGMLILGSSTAFAATNDVIKVSFIKGVAEFSQDNQTTFQRLRRGVSLPSQVWIRTNSGARLELTFKDGSQLRISENALAQLNVDYTMEHKALKMTANMTQGSAWANVVKLAGEESHFKIETPLAVAGVRGTVFRVNTKKDQATVIKVYEGAVAVAAPLPLSTSAVTPTRIEVPPPHSEVGLKEYEHLLSAMMAIEVTQAGIQAAKPVAFTKKDDKKEEPDWVNWNEARDQRRKKVS